MKTLNKLLLSSHSSMPPEEAAAESNGYDDMSTDLVSWLSHDSTRMSTLR